MTQRTRVDTTPRVNTFVTPDATGAEILPPLPPAQAIQLLPPAQVEDVADVLEGRIRAIERTSPLLQAQAFTLKYLGLSVVLCILSAGLVWYAALPAPLFLVIFGGVAVAGYWLLGLTEAQHTSFGVERLRLREGAKVLRKQIDAQTEVELARLALQAEIVQAQREYNEAQDRRLRERISAQLVRHETPQSTSNMVANYVAEDMSGSVAPVSPETETLTPPGYIEEQTQRRTHDEARRTLTAFVATLYQENGAGLWLHLHSDGRIRRSVKTPMSARSGLAAPVREQIDAILRELDRCGVWLIRYDEAQRLYRLNVNRYHTPDMAIDAIADVPTQRLM